MVIRERRHVRRFFGCSNRQLLVFAWHLIHNRLEDGRKECTSMETSEILKRLREEHALSQDELAQRVMVTRQAVSR